MIRSGPIERKLEHGGGRDFQKENDGGYFCVNTISPLSKLRRISILKQPKTMSQSPSYRTTTIDRRKETEEDFSCENESPPSKALRISLVRRLSIKTQSPSCKKSPSSGRLLAACKELVNLALTRGSLDDITVMIIDLYHFTCDN